MPGDNGSNRSIQHSFIAITSVQQLPEMHVGRDRIGSISPKPLSRRLLWLIRLLRLHRCIWDRLEQRRRDSGRRSWQLGISRQPVKAVSELWDGGDYNRNISFGQSRFTSPSTQNHKLDNSIWAVQMVHRGNEPAAIIQLHVRMYELQYGRKNCPEKRQVTWNCFA